MFTHQSALERGLRYLKEGLFPMLAGILHTAIAPLPKLVWEGAGFSGSIMGHGLNFSLKHKAPGSHSRSYKKTGSAGETTPPLGELSDRSPD